MQDGGEREAFLTADYNAEMIEHIARFPRVRDRAVFVGNLSDSCRTRSARTSPRSATGPSEHYDFAGYVTGFDPSELRRPRGAAAELGYRDDEQVCIVTVGGSGVGGHLLRRVIDAFPEAKERVPDAAHGRRGRPAHRSRRRLPRHDGLEVRAYVHELYRHLAACDLAVVQGGLTTSMELTANRRPFLYFPLAPPLRAELPRAPPARALRRGPAHGLRDATPVEIAEAIAEEIGREVDYRPVETDGAARAAGLIGELL